MCEIIALLDKLTSNDNFYIVDHAYKKSNIPRSVMSTTKGNTTCFYWKLLSVFPYDKEWLRDNGQGFPHLMKILLK